MAVSDFDEIETDIKHIAFIMDGNGRWAKKRLLPRSLGHKAGVKRINEVFDSCIYDYGIKNVSLFVFSSENWKRSEKEIAFLFDLLKEYFSSNIDRMIKQDVKLQVLGNLDDTRIPNDILKTIKRAMDLTKDCKSFTFNVLFNYGGQQDIVQAAKKIATLYKENKIELNDINVNSFKNYLYTYNLPDVDLLVRTSGEERISNCYLYQIAYGELIFTKTYWPDYSKEELKKSIIEYNSRNRRYGGIKKEDE